MRRDFKLKLYRGKWAIVWREDGATRRSSTGETDREAAERVKARFEMELDRPGDQTVAGLWSAYINANEGKPATRRMLSEWKALGPHFGHLEPANIRPQTCDDYTEKRRKAGRQDGTIWTELGDLATVLSWAHKQGYCSAAPHIKRPTKPDPKDRYLTEAEITKLLAAATSPHIRLAIILMLGTAGRIGAILDLTWDRVEFGENYIKLAKPDHMRRKGRATVPMNGMVRAALAEAKQVAMTGHVIEWAEQPVKSIKTGFNRTVKDAGLSDVTPHVLRHTAAVHMAKNGVPMSMIAQYLGHNDDRITQRVYARFAPDHMAQASEAVNFLRVVGGKDTA
jgi:integrase